MVHPRWRSVVALCTVVRFLGGAAAGCSHLGILPQAPYAVFAGLLPGLVVVLPRSRGEHMSVTTCDPGRCTPFPGI
jgi:hypothetical protein